MHTWTTYIPLPCRRLRSLQQALTQQLCNKISLAFFSGLGHSGRSRQPHAFEYPRGVVWVWFAERDHETQQAGFERLHPPWQSQALRRGLARRRGVQRAQALGQQSVAERVEQRLEKRRVSIDDRWAFPLVAQSVFTLLIRQRALPGVEAWQGIDTGNHDMHRQCLAAGFDQMFKLLTQATPVFMQLHRRMRLQCSAIDRDEHALGWPNLPGPSHQTFPTALCRGIAR